MKKFILFFLISIEVAFSCNLPNQSIKLYLTYDTSEIYAPIVNSLSNELKRKGFDILYEPDDNTIFIHFGKLGRDGWSILSDLVASYTIKNTSNDESVTLVKRKNHECFTNSSDCIESEEKKFSRAVATDIIKAIKHESCEKFQSIFDKQITLEKEQNKLQSQKMAVQRVKEEKRRQAVAELSKEQNYKKLKKVLSIKPEYLSLLDERTKTMLIGSYSLGEMSKAIANGTSEESFIRKLEKSNLTYSAHFTNEQRNYLLEAELSSKLIDYLELHTQEVEIKREQEERLARLERQREREIEEEEEAREEAIRDERRSRELQERNDANRQMWINASNALTKITNETLANLKQQAYEQKKYNTNSYSNSYSSNGYQKEYRSNVREVNNRYDDKLAQIQAKKMRIVSQKEEAPVVTCYTVGGFSPGKYNLGDSGMIFESNNTTVKAIVNFTTGSQKYPYEAEEVVFGFRTNVVGSCPHRSINEALQYIKNQFQNAEGFRGWQVRR